ncbi:MAG: hypothetical protein RR358_03400 [Cetobacterium sp.]|uniref:hypothetical protein n=1 Tax=Cetobacterium sp. 2A TaxID=2754723 RepID=UPI00163CC775|nr:hypothetical protein [Cetobacterium sp. 2A]MBC2856188.1 hypothetical protein [Cetobacterium sp. 2A]
MESTENVAKHQMDMARKLLGAEVTLDELSRYTTISEKSLRRAIKNEEIEAEIHNGRYYLKTDVIFYMAMGV